MVYRLNRSSGKLVSNDPPSVSSRPGSAPRHLAFHPSGRYACLYKRWHLIGLEVGISVASIGVRQEPTGCATGFRADAVATAKRDLKPGELLDGEGGYTVVGRLLPAADSLKAGALPLGLAHGWKVTRPVAAGKVVRWVDVVVDEANSAVRVRREMEQMCAAPPAIVLT